ncbi:PQQ-binding-like beta-propeller repeat protein [candidate division KSB1 bacterium]
MKNLKLLLNIQNKTKVDTISVTRNSKLYAGLIYCLIISFFSGVTSAQEKGEWPCFHGLNRNNKSAETGLLKVWPKTGPELLWTITGLGEGYSSVSIANGYLFTAGRIENQTYVFAFDLNGELKWKMANGQAWEATMSHARGYTGSRSTPTYDNGVVYHLGEVGRLAAFDYKTGKEKWFVNIQESFNAKIPGYGYSESVLIDGDRLYCSPAGSKGFIICLNKNNGKLIWANNEIPGGVAYTSAAVEEFGGYQHIINMSSSCVFGVDEKTGKLLWSAPFKNERSLNNTNPIYHDGYVFVSSGYGKGSALIMLNSSGGKIVPETVWETTLMDNHHGGIILLDGYLYGAGDRSRGWFCLNFMTGEQMWTARGKGSLVYADGMLYLLEEKGTMKLIKATSQKYIETGSFEGPDGGKGMHWAHPVVCGGRLYIRHNDKLAAYDIKSK